jgi:ParB-like nuclease family protein
LTYSATISYYNPAKKLPHRGAVEFSNTDFHGSAAESRSARPLGAERPGPVLALPFERAQLAECQIDDIRPSEDRVRCRTRRALKKLARSVEDYGQLVPVIVDENMQIVDGHYIWEALKTLGWRDVWIVIVAGRSDAEIRALRLALNRIPEDAAWNDQALRREFKKLIEVGFDLAFTGFEPVEIDHRLEVDVPKFNRLEDDDVPPLLAYTVTTRGDVWLCGDDRLGCGDAKDAAFIDRLLRGERADACIIDPPFNLPVCGFISGKGSQKHHEFVEASGEMSGAEFEGFLIAALRCACWPAARSRRL